MTTHNITITDLAALGALKVRSSLIRPVQGKIILLFPSLDAREIRAWQRLLTRDVFACGCGVGTLMAVGSAIMFVLWRTVLTDAVFIISWLDVPAILFVFTAGLLFGKVSGLLFARLTLFHKKAKLHELIHTRDINKES